MSSLLDSGNFACLFIPKHNLIGDVKFVGKLEDKRQKKSTEVNALKAYARVLTAIITQKDTVTEQDDFIGTHPSTVMTDLTFEKVGVLKYTIATPLLGDDDSDDDSDD